MTLLALLIQFEDHRVKEGGIGEDRMCSYINLTLVMVVGFMWLLIPIMPSSAQLDTGDQDQQCWVKITSCVHDRLNRTLVTEFNSSSLSFNKTETMCCPLIQQTVQNEKKCFCTIRPMIDTSGNPSFENSFITLLSICNIANSRASLDSLCLDASSPPDLSSIPSPIPDALAPLKAPASGSVSSPTDKKKIIFAILIAVALAILVVLIAAGIWLFSKKERTKHGVANSQSATEDLVPSEVAGGAPSPPLALATAESLKYELHALQAATSNFSDDHRIGQGVFGVVYKGTLANGQEIAVKRLSHSSWQGDKEFQNEVELVAKLQHRNLVRVMGFCLAREKLLVYELMLNKSLDYFLFDPAKQEQLNWPTRYNIIKGIAQGMLYLHEDSLSRIVHRDLRATNVLLDADMNPKISDFVMARILAEQTYDETSRFRSYDYMAPEYRNYGHFSVKSDVYSFGVVVLEIISGKSIISVLINQSGEGENLLNYAWRCCRDGRRLEVMDPLVRDSYSPDEVIRCIHLGLLCVQEEMERRPTMSTVVHMLSSDFDRGPLSMPQPPLELKMCGGFIQQE